MSIDSIEITDWCIKIPAIVCHRGACGEGAACLVSLIGDERNSHDTPRRRNRDSPCGHPRVRSDRQSGRRDSRTSVTGAGQ